MASPGNYASPHKTLHEHEVRVISMDEICGVLLIRRGGRAQPTESLATTLYGSETSGCDV